MLIPIFQPQDYIVMALKSAGRHSPFAQTPALRIMLNSVVHRWGDLREKPLHNRIFSSIDDLEIHFESSLAGT
jgi:hypothetical protein